MNRIFTVFSAAVDALVAAVIVVGVPLIVFTLMWVIQDGMTTSMSTYGSAASVIWLLANGVTVQFSADISALVGTTEPVQLVFSLAPLALTLVIVTLAARSGRSVAKLPFLWPSWLIVTLAQLAITALLSGWATAGGFVHVGADAQIFPVVLFVVPFILGSLSAALPEDGEPPWERRQLQRAARWMSSLVDTIGAPRVVVPAAPGGPGNEGRVDQGGTLREKTRAATDSETVARGVPRAGASISTFLSPSRIATRLAAITAVATVVGSALVYTVTVVMHWTDIVTLFESLHADVLGVIVLSIAQLVYVPNAVLWTTSWLSGVGFAFGTGSSVSPLGTQTGPLPALPILAALPPGELSWGFLGLLVPLLAAALAVIVVGPRFARALASAPNPWAVWGVTVAWAAACGAALLAVAASLSSGSLGLGRFIDVGPNGFAVFWALFGLFALVLVPGTAVLLYRQRRDLRGMTTTYENPLARVDDAR